ncbi:MAG TPA: winged helix-turn-helix domain-containing protein [Blastocatellia bacterium]|nr:winged helix-turn-helix domain-containing protein [Blastocatellia bacterium]
MFGNASYIFDDVCVDLQTCRVFKSGNDLRLEPKALDVLVFLIEHRGRVIEKDELLGAVWKEAFVSENAMTRVIAQLRKALGDDPRQARYIKTVQTRGYLFVADVETRATAPALAAPRNGDSRLHVESLAVLPLENLSGDAAQEYFADAMTDELITELAKVSRLRVISRTSAMRYKGVRKPLPEIARELNVEAIIEGSAWRAGRRVRITAQLIHAATDSHLWAESYERDLRDVIALQREVARTIAREVQITLTPQERARLTVAEAVNPDACDAYFKGVYHFQQGRDHLPASLALIKKSFAYFERALKLDPDYAQAHAGLANAYRWLAAFGVPALYPQAKAAARRAIELDEQLAEAHAVLGYILFKRDWDFTGAEREFHRALELAPHSIYHHGYALLLSALGRHDEAIAEINLAERGDPRSLTVKVNAGILHICARRPERALERLRETVELEPQVSLGHWALGWAYSACGDHERAIQVLQEAIRLAGSGVFSVANLAHTLARAGRINEARHQLTKLLEMADHSYVAPYSLAVIYAGLNEREQAFAALERARAEHDDLMTFLKVDPRLDSLRADARFARLQRRVGLA